MGVKEIIEFYCKRNFDWKVREDILNQKETQNLAAKTGDLFEFSLKISKISFWIKNVYVM